MLSQVNELIKTILIKNTANLRQISQNEVIEAQNDEIKTKIELSLFQIHKLYTLDETDFQVFTSFISFGRLRLNQSHTRT